MNIILYWLNEIYNEKKFVFIGENFYDLIIVIFFKKWYVLLNYLIVFVRENIF